MKQKRLMLLGGLRYLIPVIDAAHEEGYYVITCDYIPGNIAHKYSDEYFNVSIIDKEAVLDIAQKLNIDGIMSFAVDPGVVTAAYVAEKMGLPFAGSYEAVKILQNKDLFRKFQYDNGFNVPFSKSYSKYEIAAEDLDQFTFPIIVKPTDSAGSKGVSRVDLPSQLRTAFKNALDNSISGRAIIEEFIEKAGFSSDSDCFSIDGELKVVTFSSQRFDNQAPNPYVPCAFTWSSSFSRVHERYLSDELQRLIKLLDLKTSIYNVETRIGKDGKPYIMEVSPRGGGNRLSEMIRYGSGVDLIRASVRAAVGDHVDDMHSPVFSGNWAEIILHAERDGIFGGLRVSPEYADYVVESDLWIESGDMVRCFKGANDTIGTLVMCFPDKYCLDRAMSDINRWCRINII
ncbi:MAG: ATP-grasp domain-containing protein [Muribaculaceae bacterium]|nr:ATP-grasp domain-containing protein [Muribaculaceae bacterium]